MHPRVCSGADLFQEIQMKKKNETNGRYESLGIERVKSWITKCNPDLEYIGGFSNYDAPVLLRCKKCGDVFERSMITIRHGRKTICLKCKEIADQKKLEEHRAELLERKAARHEDALKRQAERKALYKEQRKHPCPCCGKITTRPKYCSDKCATRVSEKAYRHTHDAHRRARLKDQIVDRDITLEKLFERDGGICWICGMMCDYNDKVMRNKTTIAGNLFPSIDHVKPLSEGGEHSWKNIKLAHRICNTRRYKRSLTSKKVS